MNQLKPLTETEVREVINKFYELMDNRAHLIDFLEILDEDIEIRFNEISFKGHRGFEDHQEGKRKMFDEVHRLQSMDIKIIDSEAVVKTVGQWEASTWISPAPKSQRLRAVIDHTWKIRRSQKTQKAAIYSQNVDALKYIEGGIPDYLKK